MSCCTIGQSVYTRVSNIWQRSLTRYEYAKDLQARTILACNNAENHLTHTPFSPAPIHSIAIGMPCTVLATLQGCKASMHSRGSAGHALDCTMELMRVHLGACSCGQMLIAGSRAVLYLTDLAVLMKCPTFSSGTLGKTPSPTLRICLPFPASAMQACTCCSMAS